MKPPLFDYRAPTTIEEAIAALAGDDDAIVLAGGQSLLPAMNFRVAHPSLLVDIQHVAGLKGISIEGDEIVVKAMTRHRELELDEAVRRANPLIAEAMGHVAHIPIRNRGTVVPTRGSTAKRKARRHGRARCCDLVGATVTRQSIRRSHFPYFASVREALRRNGRIIPLVSAR